MLSNKIDYNELDELCVPLVRYFNNIGLYTKFSCQGHDNYLYNSFYIMFEDSITDEQIDEFLLPLSNKYDHTPLVGKFIKWRRKMSGQLASNWIYEIDYGCYQTNHRFAKSDEELLEKIRLS